ncbi:MAG: hypothetical protein AB1345_06070 [Chloroflexota bacterium]
MSNLRTHTRANTSSQSNSTDIIAMVIEIVFGVFGMMGLGWIYVGRYLLGIGLFLGWLLIVFIAALTPTIITTLTLGLGFLSYCCLGIIPPVGIVVAIISGIRVRDYVRSTGAQGSVLHLIIGAIIALILLCLAITIPLFALGGLAALGGQNL